MKKRLRQFNFVFLLAIQVALYSHASAQRATPQRPKGRTQVREVAVREMSGAAALDGRGKLWAVVIGVSKYKNLAQKSQLEFAHRDAEDFAAFLRSPNGGGYPASQLTLLTNQAATLSAIRSALGTTLPRSVEPDDMVVIFFAGHGIVEGERDGYLLAHDSDPQNLYATALQVSELNRIISERLKARSVVLIADACHSGQLGLTSRSVGDSAVMVNRFLDEVGKSGKGVFRLLGSRQDQLSYEGRDWGGGHGAFTWFLLEGLRGKADRDKDSFVRVGELLDFLSETVPKATQSLQHPRAAGDIDPYLPMAVVGGGAPKSGMNAPETPTAGVNAGDASNAGVDVAAAPKITASGARASRGVTLEIQGAPGLEVYIDSSYRGRVLPNGVLIIGQLRPGDHDLSILSSNTEPITQKISLSTTKTILKVNGSRSISSPLIAQIKQSLNNRDINGAFNLYQQLIRDTPRDPQRAAVEASLISIYESIGQNAINVYIQSSGRAERRGMFREAAEAFQLLKIVSPTTDQILEAKLKFCEGKALSDNKQYPDAVERFKSAIRLDTRAAYAYSALGQAYRELLKNDQAIEVFKQAAQLAPSWALPQLQLGILYRDSGNLIQSKEAFGNAARLDPSYPQAREQLMFTLVLNSEFWDAERLGNEIISKFPNSGLAHLCLGRIYEQSGRRDLAAEAYRKGLDLPSDISPEQRADFTARLENSLKKGKKKKGKKPL